jgi:hypothetical protein
LSFGLEWRRKSRKVVAEPGVVRNSGGTTAAPDSGLAPAVATGPKVEVKVRVC